MITHFRSQIEKGKLPLDKDSKKDLELRRPIELLPDRSTETVEAWLRAHPEVDIVSRDRGGEYAACEL
jgi:transposase